MTKYAFDDDLSTYFKASEAKNGWIGLKLDSKYLITKIGYAFPKDSKKEDYLLGIFEASNEPNFYDSVVLFMITQEAKTGEMNYVTLQLNQRFKYIRYVGPNNKYSIISELEIYGDDELGTNEKLIKSKIMDEDEDYYYQPTNLPLMIINTENSEMPEDKENYITCVITIIKDNKMVSKEKAKIKLRGNSTSRLDKKSFRIKYDKKQSPLDLPANAKSWALLANHSDKTLMRYLVAHKISSLFEMKYTPACETLDLIVNGEYEGNYGLCDQVEEGEGRIEVTEMDETCIKEPEVTGGYVFAADGWAEMGREPHYTSAKGVVYTIKYPKDNKIVPEQVQYITQYFDEVEAQVYDNSTENIDMETFCKYILIEELTGNGEAFWSTYMTKEREDGKFYFGPVWDFDLGFDNNDRIYPVLEKKDFIFKYDLSAGTMKDFAVNVLSDEKILTKLKELWSSYKEEKVTRRILINYVDEIVNQINESQRLNFIRWDILNHKVLLNPVVRGSFEAEVEYLKYFIDKIFDVVDEIVNNATFESVNAKVVKKNTHKKGHKWK